MQRTLGSMILIVTTLKILDINVDSFVSCGTISSNVTTEETSTIKPFRSSSEQQSAGLEGKNYLFYFSLLRTFNFISKLKLN